MFSPSFNQDCPVHLSGVVPSEYSGQRCGERAETLDS